MMRSWSLYLMAGFYVIAGLMHFIKPDFYLKIMPRFLPYHLELVYLSGICEIICGILLVFRQTQSLGAWLTIALLIAVYPANLQMTYDYFMKNHPQKYFSLLRLPLQFLLIYWAYQYTNMNVHQKRN